MPETSGLTTMTGTTISVAQGAPESEDASGYEALTWENVVGCVSFPEWGDTNSDVSEPTLGEGRVFHVSGTADGGEVQLTIQHRDTDPGTDLLRSKSGTNETVSIRKVMRNGKAEYGYGIVDSFRPREANNDSVYGFTCTARMNSGLTFVGAT